MAPWPSSSAVNPSMSRQSTTCVWPWRPKRFEPSWSATLLISQSRVRVSSIPTSYTAPTTPVSRIVTWRSSICPNTSVSVGRCSKRRMFTTPVVITWPLSTWVTRVIGTKMRPAPEDLDDQAQHPGLQTARTEHHDEVADLADLVARGVEDRQPGQSGREDAVGGGAHSRPD